MRPVGYSSCQSCRPAYWAIFWAEQGPVVIGQLEAAARHLGDAETTRILDFLDADDRIWPRHHGSQVHIKDRIPQDNQNGVAANGIPREVNGMPQTEALFLLDEVYPDRVIRVDIVLDLLAEIADDDRCLVKTILDDLVHDVPDDRFSGNIQENLGHSVRMRSESATNACDRYDCSHEKMDPGGESDTVSR